MERVVKRSSSDMSSILVHMSSINSHPWRCHPSLGQSRHQAPFSVRNFNLFRFAEKVLGCALQEANRISSKYALQMRRLTVEDFVAVSTDRGADTERETERRL